jgi:hypothetical protein
MMAYKSLKNQSQKIIPAMLIVGTVFLNDIDKLLDEQTLNEYIEDFRIS